MSGKKAFTTFGAGRTGSEAMERPLAALPLGITHAVEVAVPDGSNPSKIGTWIQRCALDGSLPDDVPESLLLLVQQAAGALDDPNAVIAIDMTGNAAGEKMRERLGCGADDRPYLLFGLTAAP